MKSKVHQFNIYFLLHLDTKQSTRIVGLKEERWCGSTQIFKGGVTARSVFVASMVSPHVTIQ